MSATEAAETAELLTQAKESLERYLEVHVDDDGALTFSHGDVPCVVQATRLGGRVPEDVRLPALGF